MFPVFGQEKYVRQNVCACFSVGVLVSVHLLVYASMCIYYVVLHVCYALVCMLCESAGV